MSDINLSALSQGGSVLSSLSNLILVTPEPTGITKQQQAQYLTVPDTSKEISNQNIPGLPFLSKPNTTILFQYEGENTVSLESDITEHYSEKNSPLSDNITLKPETITIHGFVGELTDEPPKYPFIINTLKQKLYVLSAYTPAFSVTALNAINAAIYAYTIANSAVSSVQQTLSTFGALTTDVLVNGVSTKVQSKQQKYFIQFYQFWLYRTLFTVQTPWAVFSNMVIKSVRAIQSADTRMITDFEVTFKRYYAFDQIQPIITNKNVPQAQNADGRAAQILQTQVNNGSSQLAGSSISFSSVLA